MNISESLDHLSNGEEIEKCSQTSGGKSGEFFFFTHDSKLMLKTISTEEMEVILPILEDYFWHMSNQQDSLIAKILGIYKFTGFETGPINFILMKSIMKVPK
jgi:hypothetical protein